MNRIFTLLAAAVIAFVFPRCGGNARQADVKAAVDSGQAVTNPDADTLSLVQGVWVNKAYVDTLKATGSPRTAQKVFDETCLVFPTSIRQPVRAILGWHEGTEYTLVRKQRRDSLWDYKRALGEIEIFSPNEIRIGHIHFVKLQHPDPDRDDFNVVEELLFAGDYRTENGTRVNFTVDGKVSGLDTIHYFRPEVDYEGPGCDVDEIMLGSTKERVTQYGFQFNKDTLLLYKLKCLEGYDSTNNSCGIVDFGELRWRLVRKK